MKKLLTIILFLSTVLPLRAQKFYIHCKDKRSRENLKDKINYKGYNVVDNKTKSDYTIECNIRCTSKINSMYKGFVSIIDTKTGKEILRTKEVRRGAVAVNGFDASANIFGVIGEKYLPDLLDKCKNIVATK